MTTTDMATPFAGADKKENMFMASVRKLVRDNWRMLVIGAGSFLGFALLFGMLQGVLRKGGGTNEVVFYSMASALASQIFASMCFGDMKTKETRLGVLMQPATAMQKFLPRLLGAFVAVPVLIAIGFLTMELGRLLGMLIRYQVGITMVNPFMIFGNKPDFDEITLLVLYWVLNLSIFFYGGILWPRLSFLKTFGLLVALLFSSVTCCSMVITWILKSGYLIVPLFSPDTMLWIITSIFLALTVMFLILSYYKFRNSTVMYNK